MFLGGRNITVNAFAYLNHELLVATSLFFWIIVHMHIFLCYRLHKIKCWSEMESNQAWRKTWYKRCGRREFPTAPAYDAVIRIHACFLIQSEIMYRGTRNPLTNVPSLHNKNQTTQGEASHSNRSLKNLPHCLVGGDVESHILFFKSLDYIITSFSLEKGKACTLDFKLNTLIV